MVSSSSIASTSHNNGEPPAQRRKLVEADHEAADILLVYVQAAIAPVVPST